jgi:hypothetical protein
MISGDNPPLSASITCHFANASNQEFGDVAASTDSLSSPANHIGHSFLLLSLLSRPLL